MDFYLAWQQLWSALGLSGHDDCFAALMQHYDEPHRHYHNRQHLAECLALCPRIAAEASYPAEVEIGLWFHDAIYLPRRSDNETRSADWAHQALLDAGADPAVAQRVHSLILATRHSTEPVAGDAKLLVDIDLAILGADAERFAEYEQQVRAEYAWVPGWLFRRKRREVLAGFLERPRLYHSPYFWAQLESKARANLARSLAILDR